MPNTAPEQPDDWTEPGPHRVADGVHRVPLPLPLDGLRAVNAYVIEAPDGPVLIDPGWAMEDTEKALAAALRDLGYELGDVATSIATHMHWDHFTQALALREKYGTPVRLGWGERHTVAAFDWADGLHPYAVEQLRRCGAPELAEQVANTPPAEHERAMPFGPPDVWLDDGDRIPVQGGQLDVVATPGHTQGHVVLRHAAAGVLVTGDHVLPHITPAIGMETAPAEHPLRDYLQSLRLVRDLPDALLLPAHGPVTASVQVRAEELIAHHEERLTAVLHEVRNGATTAYAVARALPWTRRARHFDDLQPTPDQLLAVLEIDAHLELLLDQGELTVADDGGVRVFASVG